MVYVGSKNKISKDIAPIIQSLIDRNNVQVYWEPFVGGLNMMDKIHCKYRIGSDIHKELIDMFKALQMRWVPPSTISEEEYTRVRTSPENYPSYYVGLVGFCTSFGGKYFGGYGRGFKNDGVTPRDIPNERIRNILKQIPKVEDVYLVGGVDYIDMGDFMNIIDRQNIMVYCDPPYRGTTKYATTKFDYERYYDWLKQVSKHNIVIASEYQMPDDFKCIWEKSATTCLARDEWHGGNTERLYMINPEKYGLVPISRDYALA